MSRSYEVPLLTVMLSYDYIIIIIIIYILLWKVTIALLSSTFLNAQMCQIIWTPSPPLFNGTQNKCACSWSCSCSCTEAWNAWKYATLKDV